MIERGALRVAQIMQDCAGRGSRQRLVCQAAAIEREQLEMLEDLPSGVVRPEDPGMDRRFEARRACRTVAPDAALRERSEFRAWE